MRFITILAVLNSTLTFAQQSLLYEVSGNGLDHKSYLFGTIHVQEERAFSWNDSVMWAIDQCETGAFELDMNLEKMDLGLDEEKEEALKGYVMNDLFPAIMEAIPPDSLGKRIVRDLIPFYKTILDGQMDINHRGMIVDQYLQSYCRKAGLEIMGIESWREQLNTIVGSDFTGLSELIVEFLSSDDWAAKLENFPNDQEELVAAYSELNAVKICDIIERTGNLGNNFVGNLYGRIFTDRNDLMFERTVQQVADHPTFIAVGCGHLCSANGLLAQYRAAGYTVRPMDISSDSRAPLKWTRFEQDEFSVEVPVGVDSIMDSGIYYGILSQMSGHGPNTIFTDKGVATFSVSKQDANTDIYEYDLLRMIDEMPDTFSYDDEEVYYELDEDYAEELEYADEAYEIDEEIYIDDDEMVEEDFELYEIEDWEPDSEVDTEIYIEELDAVVELPESETVEILPGLNIEKPSEEVEQYIEAVGQAVVAEMMRGGEGFNMFDIMSGMRMGTNYDSLDVEVMDETYKAKRKHSFMDHSIEVTTKSYGDYYYVLRIQGDPEVINSADFLRFFESFEYED